MLHLGWFQDSSGLGYSCDMVRFRCESYSLDSLQELYNYISAWDVLQMGVEVKCYDSFSEYNYRRLFNIRILDSDVSWTFGFGIGGHLVTGFYEYNPNKCMGTGVWDEFDLKFRSYMFHMNVVRYDLAVDIPCCRSCVSLIRDRRCYEMISHGSKTEYLGQRNKSGFVKLYDKTFESKWDFDCTRLEITLGLEDDAISLCPVVMQTDVGIKDYVDTSLTDTDRVLLLLIRQSASPAYYLNMLGRKKREKLKKKLEVDTTIVLDSKCCERVRLWVSELEL